MGVTTMSGLSYEELVRDATRYRKIRDLAVVARALEAFVALEQLDHLRSPEDFDLVLDDRIGEYGVELKCR